MNCKTAKATLRRYNLLIFLYLCLVCAVAISILFLFKSLIALAMFFVSFVASLRIVAKCIADLTLGAVLYKDLDARKFSEILTKSKYLPSREYLFDGALSFGDYETVKDTVATALQKKRLSSEKKDRLLQYLARCAFENGDEEELQKIFHTHKEQQTKNPEPFPWNYYGYYLEKDFAACKAACAESVNDRYQNENKRKYRDLQKDFYRAVACYENGDIEEARIVFFKIIAAAPTMHSATIAQLYLRSLETGKKVLPKERQFPPEANYGTVKSGIKKRMRRKILIITVFSLLLCISVLLFAFLWGGSLIRNKNKAKLNAALAETYSNAESIAVFALKKGDVHTDSFCLVNTGNALDLVELTTRDKGETFEIYPVKVNIGINTYCCVKGPFSSYYTGCIVSSNKPTAEKLYYSLKFTWGNTTYWFYVDYIEATPKG